MAKLMFLDAPFTDTVFELAEKTIVGRGRQNQLVLPDKSVSVAHCEILCWGAEILVRDLGSRNGTFVDGVKITHQQRQLKSGQVVHFGTVRARLELDPPASGETHLEITAVSAHRRFERARKNTKMTRPGLSGPRKPEQAPSSGPVDQTMMAEADSLPAQKPNKDLFETAQPPVPKPHNLQSVILGAIILGLALSAWWLVSRAGK